MKRQGVHSGSEGGKRLKMNGVGLSGLYYSGSCGPLAVLAISTDALKV
jgi:hypothetical protein